MIPKCFEYDDITAHVKIENNTIVMGIIWKQNKISEFDGWFMLGPFPWRGPIDYCHSICEQKNQVVMPYINQTDLLLNYEIDKVAFNLVKQKPKTLCTLDYQNLSSPTVDLSDIRTYFKIPSKIIDDGIKCPICMDNKNDTILVTEYDCAHTVCKKCSAVLTSCPFTNKKIIYCLDGQCELSLMRIHENFQKQSCK